MRVGVVDTVLLLLIHITGGQPARGPEILDLSLWNTPTRRRNIHVIDGRVMVITRYHKTMNRTDNAKVISRFLPVTVSALFVKYVVGIRPFAGQLMTTMATAGVEHADLCPSVFPIKEIVGKGGWDTDKLSALLDSVWKRGMGIRMNVRTYRQCIKGITRELVEKPLKEQMVFDKQAAHSARVAELHYGLDAEVVADCPAHQTWEFLCASLHWHTFLGIEEGTNHVISTTEDLDRRASVVTTSTVTRQKRQRMDVDLREGLVGAAGGGGRYHELEAEDVNEERHHKSNLSRKMILEPTEYSTVTPDFVRQGLRQMYGPNAHFKSQEQALAVSRVMARDSPLLVVLPTGGGKTDIWLLPLLSPHARITVVVTPLTVLTQDLAPRSRRVGVPTYVYGDQDDRHLSIDPPFHRGVILVTTESAISDAFITALCKICFPAS